MTSVLEEAVDAFVDSRDQRSELVLNLLDTFRSLGVDPYMDADHLRVILRDAGTPAPFVRRPPLTNPHDAARAGWH